MFLVTAASGNVGTHLVERLLDAGVEVRALSRNPAAAGLPPGAEIVSMRQGAFPLDGVTTIFLNPAAVHETADALLAQAVSCRVRRVVLLSSSSVLDDHPANHTGVAHRDLERRIERTGLEWTFLRSGVFAANTLQWSPQIHADGVVRGAHASALIAPIHERDLAAAAAAAMLSDDLIGAAPVLTGPELMTQTEQATLIGDSLGKTVRFEEITPEAARENMIARQVPPQIADSLLRYYERAAEHPIEPTPISVPLTGEHPRTYHQWVLDHATDFRSSVPA
ncbi:NAD(P)H-binding protein [Nocardia sp. NBC_00508]|uniref:NAD(P)H-binding protein n=1 Tax=Nocardia sp. NBC_00508 TaxID=2975992 RepID=UPI002E81332F|nr:NAD(P)H-binding protein [Nocardia sp. NBC_00508]WUD67214.1 NAD(P)H-binding protein [Nocardia sp. NBC_00508]